MLVTWGANQYGQRCLNKDEAETAGAPRCVNASVPRDAGVVSVSCVAAGAGHTAILTSTGDVFTCGRGYQGQLGVGQRELKYSRELVRVASLARWRIAHVTCGNDHCFAVTDLGRTFEWGSLLPFDEAGNLAGDAVMRRRGGLGTDFNEDLNEKQRRIVAESWSQYLTNGACENKIQGDDAVKLMTDTERRRCFIHIPRVTRGLEGTVTRFASCGYAHTVAVSDQGQLFAAGYNEKGQLGNGTRRPSAEFCRVALLEGQRATIATPDRTASDFSFLACGLNHSAVITDSGSLLTWGYGVFGQLGLGQHKKEICIPELVRLGATVSQVACGDQHTIALTSDGNVFSFGHKDVVGGNSHLERIPERRHELCVASGKRVDRLFAGGTTCFATVAPDKPGLPRILHSWGYNQRCELGRSAVQRSSLIRPAPIAWPWLPGGEVRCFDAGSHHCVAVLEVPTTPVVAPEVGDVYLGNPALIHMLGGSVSYDVAVAASGGQLLGAHRCVLKVRCPELFKRLQPTPSGMSRQWQLNLKHINAVCVKVLLEYLYCDFARASARVAADLRPLADELSLEHLAKGLTAATETKSEDEAVRWVRSPEGKWVEVRESAATASRTESANTTYTTDLAALVVSETEDADDIDFIELSITASDLSAAKLYVARALLLTVDFFHALLEGGFSEANTLRSGSASAVAVTVEDVDAFVLCLQLLATGDVSCIPTMQDWQQVLALLREAHRLELPAIVAAAEAALGRAVMMPHVEQYLGIGILEALKSAAALYDLPKLATEVTFAAKSLEERTTDAELKSITDTDTTVSSCEIV